MRTKFWLAAVFIILAFSLALVSPAIGSVTSANREFNSTQDSAFLNYTNSYSQNITLWSNASYDVFVNISNSSTTISANYSQPNTATACQQPNIGFVARNASNDAASQANISTVGSNTNLTLFFSTLSCLPGRYWGSFVVMNSTNATENLTISADIQIPISANNYQSLPTTGLANLTASMPGNASAFHRYYFNTSAVGNSTSITINLSSAQDIDVFLFNSTTGKLLAKSINKSNSSEWLTFWPLTANTMYEIRVFGNITNASSTPYTFHAIFSTLNATYASEPGKPATNLSFGSLNTSMINTQNITLKNEGNFAMDGIVESKEIYYVKRWEINTSSAASFDGLFMVPSFATKIRIAANWTNVTQNYSVYLTAPDKAVTRSSGRFINANVTNASLEEYIETAGIAQGYWNASVRHNADARQSNYTLTAYVWYPASEWLATNYSSMTFNASGNNNSAANVSINFTASNNSIGGSYEGFLQYATAQGAALRIPFTASVNASSLVANGTIGSAAVQIDENIGANLTKSLNITLNNTGSYPLSFALENSTNNSNALWYGARFINFTYHAPPSPLSAGANHLVNVTLILDPNTTGNGTGVYEGYIKFITNDSRPYQNFTLTLRVNLTNDLNVVLSQTLSVDGDADWINQSAAETFKAPLNVYYANGTEINNNILNTSNFTSAWLTSANISYRIPATGSLGIANGTNPIYSASKYNLNLTVPANQPGGIYQLHIGANYYRGDHAFDGEGAYNYIYINNSGLSMSTNSSTSISIANASTSIFYANISNYGPTAASSATIQFNETCSGYSAAVTGSVGCSGSQSGDTFTISPAANSNTCLVWWTITAGSSAAGACTAGIIGASGSWYDTRGINVSITVTAPESSSSTATTTTTTTTTTNTTAAASSNSDISIMSYPSETRVVQNSTGGAIVSVKNSGTLNLTGVNVYVDGIEQGWYVRPATQNIGIGAEKSFSITFNIPASAQVASYPIKYIANNSAATKNVSASLMVTPNNQTAVQINASFLNYTARYEQMSLLLNQSKAKGMNLTDAEVSLAQIKDMLDRAGAYISGGDYFNAYQLISQMDGLLKTAEAEITGATPAAAGSPWIWIITGIAVVLVAAFIVYIALPPKHGFAPDGGYKFVHPEARGKTNLALAKEKIDRLLEKVKGKFLKKPQHPLQAYAYSGTG